MENTPDYHRRREERARSMAGSAISPTIAAIHLEMAAHYQNLVDADGSAPPRGRGSSPA